jgi:outer membrane protein OmpA-like peptidoglycan-associated protein
MFGAFGAGTMNIHRGLFSTYDGILECGTFEDTETLGWQAGNVLDIPLAASLGLSTRLYYHRANGDFNVPNPVSPNISLEDGTLVRLNTEHNLKTALDYVMLDLLGKWNFTEALYLAAGPSVGLSTRAAYEQEEQIITPRGVTFANGQSSRTIVAGNFDEQGTQNAQRELRIAATGALGADIPLTERFVLNPEIGYTFSFTNVLSTFDWKVSAVRAGIALKYMFGGETIIRDTAVGPPAAVPAPVLALDAQNIMNDGTRLNYAEVTITEDRLSDVMPLLPYVFFAQNSSAIQQRYHQLAPNATSGFNESALRDSVLGIYHDVLNIIGDRMRRYPEATISVTGTREPLEDTEGASVAAERASRVKEYLVNIWKIEPSRIATTSRVLPQAVSNRTIPDGREENRRAEITSSDPRVLAPVQRASNSSAIEPAAIAIVPRVQFGESIRDWKVTVEGMNGTLWSTTGNGVPGSDVVWTVDRNKVINDGAAKSSPGHLTATLTANREDGSPITAVREIPVRRVISSRRISGEVVRDSLLERYALMFFDFDTPNVSDFNTQVLELIQSRMRTNSAVRITGLTDRIGEESYNQMLSTKRADATAKRIQARIVPKALSAKGAGEELIYNNDLPEGRFYNRTVVIEIATPVEGAL